MENIILADFVSNPRLLYDETQVMIDYNLK